MISQILLRHLALHVMPMTLGRSSTVSILPQTVTPCNLTSRSYQSVRVIWAYIQSVQVQIAVRHQQKNICTAQLCHQLNVFGILCHSESSSELDVNGSLDVTGRNTCHVLSAKKGFTLRTWLDCRRHASSATLLPTTACSSGN